jgi:hypothetical protein
MMGGALEVRSAGTPVADIGYNEAFKAPNAIPIFRSQYDRMQAFASVLRDRATERRALAHAPALAAAAPPAPDIPAQIPQLATLRDAGVLTEEEFSAKKAELLARL